MVDCHDLLEMGKVLQANPEKYDQNKELGGAKVETIKETYVHGG
jgi:hypothetical protein